MERNKNDKLETISNSEIIKNLSVEYLLDYKEYLLNQYNEIEKQLHLLNETLVNNGIELDI